MSSADAVLASARKLEAEYVINFTEAQLRQWASDAVKVIRVLSDRPQPSPSSADKISDERLARILDDANRKYLNAGSQVECTYWQDRINIFTELATRRTQSAVVGGGVADFVRAANGLLNTLWQGVYSGSKSFEENWQEMERRYPQSKWLHDAAKTFNATQEGN